VKFPAAVSSGSCTVTAKASPLDDKFSRDLLVSIRLRRRHFHCPRAHFRSALKPH
jgi:hypothetical protein